MNKKKSRTNDLKTVGKLLANHIDSILENCEQNIIPISQEKKEILEQASEIEQKPNDNLPIEIPKPIENKKKLPPIKNNYKIKLFINKRIESEINQDNEEEDQSLDEEYQNVIKGDDKEISGNGSLQESNEKNNYNT